ncbi:hypothetical protein [Marinoscillum pacificum]|uniref:hypothetical protein n=1 Tax=Marinoscillum pacificum TaxID=392723 RepID=UPI00215862D4|nr:hypothetical protein [Marinoscillum pacificum]
MKYYLVYSYNDNGYRMVTSDSAPEGDMEVLYEFEEGELAIAKKVLASLSLESEIALEKVA